MGIRTEDLLKMTARELTVRYDAFLMDRWNHTARLSTYLQNIAALICGFGSKKPPKMVTFEEEHPLMFTEKTTINADNFKQMLKPMFTRAEGRNG